MDPRPEILILELSQKTVLNKLLLDNKAEVNAQGGEYGNALQAAASGSYQVIVQLLFEKQAEVNA
ncbi:hypothetical protein BH09PAT4_BH09PAT4_09680 [soil metagenome]